MPWPCSQALTILAFSRVRKQPSLQEHLAAAGKDTSFNMLVSRVCIKLDEDHLLLKLALFMIGTKRNSVKNYFTSTEYIFHHYIATGSGNFAANSNGTTVQLQYIWTLIIWTLKYWYPNAFTSMLPLVQIIMVGLYLSRWIHTCL